MPGENVRAVKAIALGTALVAFAFSIIAILGFQVDAPCVTTATGSPDCFQFQENVPWIPFFGI